LRTRIAALVPMRHTSERVPGKNYRRFGGKPLFYHILNRLVSCGLVDRVVVDTDSPVIMNDVKQNFPGVALIERAEHLRAGTVPMNEVLAWDIAHVEADVYLQTHSTNPLLKAETIRRAIEHFQAHQPTYDSLFSVTRLQVRLWGSQARPINHNLAVLLRTQDLPPVFEENSNLYIFTRDSFEKAGNRIGERPLMFEIDRLEAVDIDEEIDFQIAEFLYGQFSRKQSTQEGDIEKSSGHGPIPAVGHRPVQAAF
jgi:CMP-N-acetylneuraminic acid synthetase